MFNFSTNLRLFLDITKSVFKSKINTDSNLKYYPRKPKLSDCEILALALTAESMGIDSKNYLFGKLKKDYAVDFPHLIHRCNFNRRRKALGSYLQQLNECLSNQLNEGENALYSGFDSCTGLNKQIWKLLLNSTKAYNVLYKFVL